MRRLHAAHDLDLSCKYPVTYEVVQWVVLNDVGGHVQVVAVAKAFCIVQILAILDPADSDGIFT